MEFAEVLPRYGPDHAALWDGWEAREVGFECASVLEQGTDEPGNYTVVLEIIAGVALCGATLIFVGSGAA